MSSRPFASQFQKVPQAPTNPGASHSSRKFDVADLYQGPLRESEEATDATQSLPLDEKLRQAYFWIVNTAIISPFYDIEFDDGPSQSYLFGDSHCEVRLPSGQSYSSFVLLPLLNLAVRRRCLLVGGPGRGKTASAILMGLLAGYPLKEIKRGIQHGQPQMTVADLLGNPLPADMVKADNMDEIRIAWRKWLGMRVKIIDEYNRIPTRTQSALLTVMADNYAELLDHIYECPDASWYLTANDDAGGGTYPVIEALRDRIDIVVKALHFNTRFVGDLLHRIEAGVRPQDLVPQQIIFTEDELSKMEAAIRRIELPLPLRKRLEFFCSQFEFSEAAAEQLEYKTKDTIKLSGLEYASVSASETGKDRIADLGFQTRNGLSVRALMTVLVFVKALAYFRGNQAVSLDDIRQILPFVFHDKLEPNLSARFFDKAENAKLRVDRLGWIRKLFDISCEEYDRLDRDHSDPVDELAEEFQAGLDGVSAREVRNRRARIERILSQWSNSGKLYGHHFDDILKLKYFHQRYTNYLRWLEANGG